MASLVAVESLYKGSALRQLPDGHMIGKKTQITTAVGAVIKHNNGMVWHKFKKTSEWEMAVYHHSIRPQLIDYAKAMGNFDVEPAARKDNKLDVTSFHIDQQSWGPTRDRFPRILFVYAPPSKKKRAGELRFMYFNREIVLDKNHRPVRAWPELNLTLSSKVEGFRLEALQRLNPHISSRDMLARMLPEITVQRSRGKTSVVRSQMKANALSMRKRDFRGRNGFLSWTIREGSKEIKDYLDSLLGPELVAMNNTRNMRPLTPEESEQIMFLIGKGRHPERSRHKTKTYIDIGEDGTALEKPFSSMEKDDEAASDTDVLTDTEDHVEAMDFDGEQDEEDPDAHDSTNIEDHFEPLNAHEGQDEGTGLQSEYSFSEPDPEDFLDCRNHRPQDNEEVQIIAIAIAASINHYNSLLITELTIDAADFHWESYSTQWLALQEALERGWVSLGGDPDECPILVRMPGWDGDIKSWMRVEE